MKEVPEIEYLDNSILNVLNYYSIFRHPLTINEILQRSPISIEKSILESRLTFLNERDIIHRYEIYYSLEKGPSIVERRKQGENRAKKLLKIARIMSGLVYLFPFVRGVFISGSLSKGSVPDDADIDFFVITKRNRLWISRMTLVLFKRLFLFNSKKYFCTNYFVDEDNLEIPDKNLFTATEIATLIPMRGEKTCVDFMKENEWYSEFFPNWQKEKLTIKESNNIKNYFAVLEFPFRGKLGENCDKAFMKRTYKRWVSLYSKKLDEECFELAFRSHRGTSKNHDKDYQSKVLKFIDDNVNASDIQPKLEEV